jgi:hypothetical protein
MVATCKKRGRREKRKKITSNGAHSDAMGRGGEED